ncbi:MAG: 5-demethoxyubiquinol-8 5-hydroxylase UbiM [Hyphomonadaceae bacterium]|nr:5-demethoxyubiquinol-8 5-hydroxylase UbiM [Hyphomonadaceae bacterium]
MATLLDADIVIAGAGPAGLSLAAALAQAPLRIIVVERAPLRDIGEPRFDGREIAITHASMRRLETIGAWRAIPATDISPLRRARVLDGLSPFALHFDSRRPGEALGALVPNASIRKALFQTVSAQSNCTIIPEHAVISISPEKQDVTTTLSDGRVIRSKLAVAADTRFSPLRQAQGISAHMVDFGRTMLVCRMAHSTPHEGIATEWFGQKQTIAMLPLSEGRSSYVLTLPAHEIDALMALSPEAFAEDAQKRTLGRWGRLELASTRHAYPLVAVYADAFVAPRFALVGDAAVGMHPVTAHGFNFGLAGACRLAELIKAAAVRGSDLGGTALLQRYARTHRRATWPLFAATNALAQLYTDNRPIARLARTTGLRLMHAVDPVRHAIEARISA